MKDSLIILADGFEEVEATVPMDLLRRANIKLTVSGISSKTVIGSHNITYTADTTLNDIKEDCYDAIIIPGGMPGTLNLLDSPKVISLVKEHYSNKKLCCAICAGPRVLDKAGVLSQKHYTCFPTVNEDINTGIWEEKTVIRDGNIITSRGVGTAIPFALEIISYLLGENASKIIAEQIVHNL